MYCPLLNPSIKAHCASFPAHSLCPNCAQPCNGMLVPSKVDNGCHLCLIRWPRRCQVCCLLERQRRGFRSHKGLHDARPTRQANTLAAPLARSLGGRPPLAPERCMSLHCTPAMHVCAPRQAIAMHCTQYWVTMCRKTDISASGLIHCPEVLGSSKPTRRVWKKRSRFHAV